MFDLAAQQIISSSLLSFRICATQHDSKVGRLVASGIYLQLSEQTGAISPGKNTESSHSQMMIRVSNHLLSMVFSFHYHSQKMIASLGVGSVSGCLFFGKNSSIGKPKQVET